ncbi:muscle, skeletal receptor tyrosine-protein kinase-like, partial [Saccoglossus kowalevskii]
EPFILQPSYDIGVDIGMNMSLPCVSYGFPRPQTFWYKKDDSLETNKRAKIGEDGTLFIRDLQVEDEGTYVCVVENQFGKEEVSAYLRITGIVRPVIAFSNPEINVVKGSHTAITCQILIGNSPPTIRC